MGLEIYPVKFGVEGLFWKRSFLIFLLDVALDFGLKAFIGHIKRKGLFGRSPLSQPTLKP
jgi:hypothetical protein